MYQFDQSHFNNYTEKYYDLYAIRYGGQKEVPSSHYWCFKLAGPDGERDVSYFYPIHRYNPYEGTSIWTITGIGCPFAGKRNIHGEYRFATIPSKDFNDCFVLIEHSEFDPIHPTPAAAADEWAYNCVKSLYLRTVISSNAMRRFERYQKSFTNTPYWTS